MNKSGGMRPNGTLVRDFEETQSGRNGRTDPAIIHVRDLYASYGAVEAVRGVSFEVFGGEVFGLLGPNGAGKTTTLETIEGLRPVQRGSVLVDGIDVAADPVRVRRMIGVQLQQVA